MLGLLFFLDVVGGLHSLSILYITAGISMLKMEKISHISTHSVCQLHEIPSEI
jgi:hypothetical protein